jgi:hypothetical protein
MPITHLLRLAIVAGLLALLAACTPVAPPPRLSDVPRPSDADLAPAEPLPDVPACNQPREAARTACRVAYDERVRRQYVELGGRHATVAGWVRIVTTPPTR